MSFPFSPLRVIPFLLILTAGTVPGPGWAQPQVPSSRTPATQESNHALEFRGDDYVTMGEMNLSGSALTIEAWVKPSRFPNTIHTIAGIEKRGADAALLRVGDAGLAPDRVQFVLKIGRSQTKLAARSDLDTGEWQHVAAVYDGNQMRIYIDGELDAKRQANGRVQGTGVFRISKSFGSRYFFGTIDEVRVWKTARTGREIHRYRERSLPGNSRDLKGYWPFDLGRGNRATDERNRGKVDSFFEKKTGVIKGASWVRPGAPIGNTRFRRDDEDIQTRRHGRRDDQVRQRSNRDADAQVPEVFRIRFSEVTLGIYADGENPHISAEGGILSYGQDWDVKRMKDFLFHMRRDEWDDFYWKVNTSRKEVYKVEGGTFGAYGGREETVDITVDPAGGPEDPQRFVLRFPKSNTYMGYRPEEDLFWFVLARTMLFKEKGGQDWDVEQVKPFLYHIRKRSWEDFFWKVNTSREGMWWVENGSFGGYGGEEEEMDVSIYVE